MSRVDALPHAAAVAGPGLGRGRGRVTGRVLGGAGTDRRGRRRRTAPGCPGQQTVAGLHALRRTRPAVMRWRVGAADLVGGQRHPADDRGAAEQRREFDRQRTAGGTNRLAMRGRVRTSRQPGCRSAGGADGEERRHRLVEAGVLVGCLRRLERAHQLGDRRVVVQPPVEHRIVRNRAVDHLRGAARRHDRAERLDTDFDRPSADDTEAAAAESMSTAAAIELVASLPRDQAEAVLLRAVVGLDARSAGDVLGKGPGAVRVSAHRGLKTLARRLGEALSDAAAQGRPVGSGGGS